MTDDTARDVDGSDVAGTRTGLRTIGFIGAGEVGSTIARAAVRAGYRVVLSNRRGPHTLTDVVASLGPTARAGTQQEAAEAGDFVVVAAPLTWENTLPVEALAGKVVIDTNNYMAWRDGVFDDVESGRVTEHERRQQHLPDSYVVKAFTHIQAPRLFMSASPTGSPGRHALSVSSDFPAAAALVARFQDEIGFDTVDNSPLSESWRTGPGQPAWNAHVHQTKEQLARHLRLATRLRGR